MPYTINIYLIFTHITRTLRCTCKEKKIAHISCTTDRIMQPSGLIINGTVQLHCVYSHNEGTYHRRRKSVGKEDSAKKWKDTDADALWACEHRYTSWPNMRATRSSVAQVQVQPLKWHAPTSCIFFSSVTLLVLPQSLLNLPSLHTWVTWIFTVWACYACT